VYFVTVNIAVCGFQIGFQDAVFIFNAEFKAVNDCLDQFIQVEFSEAEFEPPFVKNGGLQHFFHLIAQTFALLVDNL